MAGVGATTNNGGGQAPAASPKGGEAAKTSPGTGASSKPEAPANHLTRDDKDRTTLSPESQWEDESLPTAVSGLHSVYGEDSSPPEGDPHMNDPWTPQGSPGDSAPDLGAALGAAGNKVGNAASSVVNNVWSTASAVGSKVGTTATAVGDKIGTTATAVGDKIGTTATAVGDKIGTTATAVGDKIGTTATAVGDKIGTTATAVGDKIGTTATAVGDKIGTTATAVGDKIGTALGEGGVVKELADTASTAGQLLWSAAPDIGLKGAAETAASYAKNQPERATLTATGKGFQPPTDPEARKAYEDARNRLDSDPKLKQSFKDNSYGTMRELLLRDDLPGKTPEERLNFLQYYTDGSDQKGKEGQANFTNFRVEAKDTGFATDLRDGDLHGGGISGNQMGHFLTAVRIGSDDNTARREMFKRAAIGHEKISDDGNSANTQALAGTRPEDAMAFNRGVAAAERGDRAGVNAAAHSILPDLPELSGSQNGVSNRVGNSLQDMRLTTYGYAFGEKVRNGDFRSREEMVAWLDRNVGAPSS